MPIFSQLYTEIPLNTEQIPASALNIEEKKRSNPLTWKGQFSPQLVEVLLHEYAAPGAVVFDPFVGSGTVLLESGRLGFSAYGTEINPAAVLLAQTYKFINLPIEERVGCLVKVQEGLRSSLSQLEEEAEQVCSSLIKTCLSDLLGTISDRREYQLLETLVVLLDYWEAPLSYRRVFEKWMKLRSHVQNLPFSKSPIEVFQADARQTPLKYHYVDLVVTSPPYINVFNYHQQYRASVEALNWDVLTVAKSEIGSNRKHRSNRFLTAIQYCLDMAQTFKELSRVCQPDGQIIFVVGRESMIRGIPFYNGELVAEVANTALGFELILRQERCFTNRFGAQIFEDILHFKPGDIPNGNDYIPAARVVAEKMLSIALQTAPTTIGDAIREALNNSEAVLPSKIFVYSHALNHRSR